MVKVINVTTIDDKMVDELESAYKSIHASTDEEKKIHLNLNKTTGDIEKAYQAAEIMHSNLNKNITPVTKASGTLDAAASLLFAVGCPGNRIAEPDAQFTLNDGGEYSKESEAEDLEGSDAKVYYALIKMGGNKNRVLDNIKSGGKFSAAVGKKMKIVDEIDGFKNAFAPTKTGGRGRKKTSDSKASVENADLDLKGNLTTKNSAEDQKENSESIQSNPPLKGKRS
jgi:hypothetical protein